MKRGTDLKLKFKLLRSRLGFTNWQTKGILQSLWDFTAENAMSGDIGRYPDEEIAIGIDYEGDAAQLIATLVETRWLDEHAVHRLVIHDWHEHCEEWIVQRMERAGIRFASLPGGESTESIHKLGRRGTTGVNGEQRGISGVGGGGAGTLPAPGPAPAPGPGPAPFLPGLPPGSSVEKKPKKPKPEKKPREPDPTWDAVVAVWFPSGVPPSQLTRVGAIVRDLKAVHATPEEIRRRSANCRVRFEGRASVNALAKHWDLCKDVLPRPERLGKVEVEPGKYDNVKIMRAGPYRGPSGDGSVQPSQAAGNAGARGTG